MAHHSGSLITLPASAFDGRQKFLDAIRITCKDSTINLGAFVNGSVIAEYAAHLKESYWSLFSEGEEAGRDFFVATHLGHQADEYWILSEDVHIWRNKLLCGEDHRYLVMEDELRNFNLSLNERLLNWKALKETLKIYFELSMGFAQNVVPFSLATSFVVARILRNATAAEDVWTEGSIGLLYSKERCVGKSLTLQILALGQGIPRRSHRLFLSGGNQLSSGTSTKKVNESVARTSFVVMVDDPNISTQFGEFLLQAQGGLLQGSAQQGLTSAKGSILLSANSKEVSRIIGRVIRINYRGANENDALAVDVDKLHNELLPLVQRNKGLLLAWSMRFMPIWDVLFETFVKNTTAILGRLLPQQQNRWTKGVSCVIFAFTLLRMSIGEEGVTEDAILEFANAADKEPSEPGFIFKLEQVIRERVQKEPSKILTWLNPCVNVSSNGVYVKAFGLKSSVLEQTPHFTHLEMIEDLKSKVDQVTTSSMWFSKSDCSDAGLDDLSKRSDKTQQHRGRKFPIAHFSPEIISLVKKACGLEKEGDGESRDTQREDQYTDCLTASEQEIVKNLESLIKAKIEAMEDRCREGQDDSGMQEILESIEVIQKGLTPRSKAILEKYTPRRLKAFQLGFECGSRKSGNDDSRISPPTPATTNAGGSGTLSSEGGNKKTVGNTPSAALLESADNTACKKRLFTEGAVGVLESQGAVSSAGTQKSQPKHKKMRRYIYCICKEERSKEEENSMLVCETKARKHCPGKGYYHMTCLGLRSLPRQKIWLCDSCKQSSGKKSTKC
ncbi:uncharacterized protein LOC144667472 [Oculina patagonica]